MHRYALSFALVGLATGVIAAGCGSDPPKTQDPPPTTGIPIENIPAATAEAFCGRIFTCCDMAETAGFMDAFNPPPTTQAECETALPKILDPKIFQQQQEAVLAGRLAYDAEQAARCYDISDEKCSDFSVNFFGDNKKAICRTVFTGKVASGGDCLLSAECASAGFACVGAMPPAFGKCMPLPKENEPCPKGECSSGLACSSDAIPICTKPKADGSACGSHDECVSYFCNFDTMKCATKVAIGGACTTPSVCSDDAWCDVAASICKAKKAAGETCVDSAECASAECDMMNKCGAPACDGM